MQATAAARTPRPSRALRLPSPRRRSPRRFSVSWMTALGLATGVALTLFALLGQMLVDADPDRQDLTARLAKPVFLGGSWDHPFGTDQLGRDIFARMASGLRLSFAIGLIVTLMAGLIGVVLGLVAAAGGTFTDRAIRFLVDVQIAIPAIILAIAAAALFSPGLAVVVVVLAFSGWVGYQRVVRMQTRALLQAPFVEASRAMGGSRIWIVRKHMFPNTIGAVIVIASQQIAAVILFEAALSYLGLGVSTDTITLGGMVAQGREAMLAAWWVPALPGAAIALTVLSLNLIGDGLRRRLDPRNRL